MDRTIYQIPPYTPSNTSITQTTQHTLRKPQSASSLCQVPNMRQSQFHINSPTPTHRSTVTSIMDPVKLRLGPCLVQVPRRHGRAHDIIPALHNSSFQNVSHVYPNVPHWAIFLPGICLILSIFSFFNSCPSSNHARFWK
jgi:hypothetical protein